MYRHEYNAGRIKLVIIRENNNQPTKATGKRDNAETINLGDARTELKPVCLRLSVLFNSRL